jgi:subtilisin family serine protease
MCRLFILLALLGLWSIPASPAERKPNLLFWEQAHGYYNLDEQAYTLVGLPFSSDTSNVTVVIIDGWDDGHGQTVEAIIRHGAQGANTVRMDFVYPSLLCPIDPFAAYVLCTQNIIADFVEMAARNSGLTIVNMSLGLYYSAGRDFRRLIEEKGCDNSSKINLDSLRRMAEAINNSPPDKIWVAAAGNYGISGGIGFPACLNRVYSAAALKRERQYDPQALKLASYSNYSLRERSYAQPIGGVMKGPGSLEFEGTSFAAPLMTALLANIVSLCYQEPAKLNPTMRTREGVGVVTVWSADCQGL